MKTASEIIQGLLDAVDKLGDIAPNMPLHYWTPIWGSKENAKEYLATGGWVPIEKLQDYPISCLVASNDCIAKAFVGEGFTGQLFSGDRYPIFFVDDCDECEDSLPFIPAKFQYLPQLPKGE
jgi:hypothetical protein